MDPLPSLLNAPWAQPLLGLVITAIGSWLGTRKSPPGGGITQTATTHGTNSRVTQTVNQNTWHIAAPQPTPRHDPHPPETRGTHTGATSTGTNDDEAVMVIGLGAAALIGVAALTWAVAVNWSAVAATLRLLTLAALFITALTWWRWPHGVRGARGLRVLVTVLGCSVLWALTALPLAVRGEPTLPDIERATRGLSAVDSIGRTIRVLGLDGTLAYEMRLGGVVILLLLLLVTSSRGLGAVIAETAARHDPPRMALVRLGNWLIGAGKMGVGYFVGMAALSAMAVAMVHPVTIGWLMDHIATASMP